MGYRNKERGKMETWMEAPVWKRWLVRRLNGNGIDAGKGRLGAGGDLLGRQERWSGCWCWEIGRRMAGKCSKRNFLWVVNYLSGPSTCKFQGKFCVAEFTAPLPPPPSKGFTPRPGPNPLQLHFQQMGQYIKSILESRSENPNSTRPVFAVVDSLMCWSKEVFMKFGVPVVALFTFGAVGLAMEHATWKADVENLKPGETRLLPGLPDYMAFSYSDLRSTRKGSDWISWFNQLRLDHDLRKSLFQLSQVMSLIG
ncbi:hypothetical protein ACH5RR_040692 [Cinchona calisaya]|uniref:Uncharacterized protein n=1 Tax=Cinchona calisaya TaxID=153742 RepID=A0ABD2XUZ0_9GENT